MKKLIQSFIVFGLVAMMGGVASGDALQDGLDAYNKRDFKKALMILEPLAWQGKTEAQFILGQIYHKKNHWKQSFMWHLVAAKKGHAISQRYLGFTYHDGKGVKEDVIMALGWYKQAVKNGDPKAQGYIEGMRKDGLYKGWEQRVKEAKDHEQRVLEDFKEQGPKRIAGFKAAEEQRIAEAKAAEEQRIAEAKAAEEQRIAEDEEINNSMKGIKPERQKEFLKIVSTHAEKYKKTKKEIKKSLYRKKRIKAFSSFFDSNLCFENWVGTVKSLDTDKNGDAILRINIGEFEYLNYGTKAIPMSDSLFDTVAEMEENDKVVLDGCFSKHNDTFADNWYLFTHEKTENGAMTSPTFQGSYSYIKKVNISEVPSPQTKFESEKKSAVAESTSGKTYQDARNAYKKKDYKTAYKLSLHLSEKGNAKAQLLLGKMHDEGQGVAQDNQEAIRLYRLSAEQGLANAQYMLGYMYNNGEGVPRDYKEAIKWWKLAAEQGLASAQDMLGYMYHDGEGVPRDYKEAGRWSRFSAEQGDAFAQYRLGVLYYNGHGVPKDHVSAHMWFNLAGSKGDKNAVTNKNMVGKNMSPQQIEKAQEMARNWKPKDCYVVACDLSDHQ
jgi:uncharacterized protein